MVNANVGARAVFATIRGFNLMSAVSIPNLGTMLVVSPDQEDDLLRQVHEAFGIKNAMSINAETYTPEDWNQPGFIDDVLGGIEGEPDLVMTSGLGLHVSIRE